MRTLIRLLASTLILAAGSALVLAQQQAAEAPAANRTFYTRPAVAARSGLVTTGHPIASSAGLQMLIKGGNAFDAAAAVGAMAALGEPEMNGIGGNGFMTIYHKATGKVWSVSMAGAAPKALVPSEMTPETLNAGMKAGIVPGNLGGYLSALERFGTMTLAEVFAPAIEYAEQGYPIDPMLAQSIARGRNNLSKYPTSAKIFLPTGEPLKAGELLKNPDYAATLRKLVEAEQQARAKGATREAAIRAASDRFYKGDIAQEFDRFFKANGGLLTAADLAGYAPQWTEPLHTRYRGHDVYSNPATSRGGFEVLMGANLIEPVDLAAAGPGSPAALHAVIEAIKISKADIYRYVADPGVRHRSDVGPVVARICRGAPRAVRSRKGHRLSSPRSAGRQPIDRAARERTRVRGGVRRRAAHDVVLDRRSVRQRRRLHAHARRALRQ